MVIYGKGATLYRDTIQSIDREREAAWMYKRVNKLKFYDNHHMYQPILLTDQKALLVIMAQ